MVWLGFLLSASVAHAVARETDTRAQTEQKQEKTTDRRTHSNGGNLSFRQGIFLFRCDFGLWLLLLHWLSNLLGLWRVGRIARRIVVYYAERLDILRAFPGPQSHQLLSVLEEVGVFNVTILRNAKVSFRTGLQRKLDLIHKTLLFVVTDEK